MNPLLKLAEQWQSEADRYERDGALVQGDALLRRIADELETAWNGWQLEELTVAQAAGESGYSEDHLRQLVREGRIPDDRPQGSKAEIRVRRCDLPRKPASQRQPVVEEMATALLSGRL